MPQLSPLFWVVSSFMVMFLLMSMMVIFYESKVSISVINKCKVSLVEWCW
uniref:ATP synthase F0 subunit 8 n=1 Tax=Austrarchaea sp. Kanangra-Boyd NP TaxID=1028206 RepID=H2E4C2_9ARAC|nr:ATP synthase F0 subunit 8 [Austrarchaea sp. Kanangra-Boyd NP]AEX89034.1 ATP synthase F0 subunit 8 [Austrarchaea sp. Kanangra-Boyd NP]AEX89037.1 ATP synthase F0 subunit 8 [Austrarchaea sp. Kanangra-Boyd NP]